MDNISNAIDATANKDVIGFKKALHSELSTRLHAAISTNKESIAKKISTEEVEAEAEEVEEANISVPSAPFVGGRVGIPGSERSNSGVGEVPNPLAEDLKAELESAFGLSGNPTKTPATESSEKAIPSPAAGSPPKPAGAAPREAAADPSLDPNFEKEFYIKETDYKGHKILLKQVGLGLSKPVRVYVDGKRWEFFAGPESAVAASRSYIDSMKEHNSSDKDTSKIKEETEISVEEAVSLDARTKLYRETKNRVSQYLSKRNSPVIGEKQENRHAGLYDSGDGIGAIIPKPFNFLKPSDTAKRVAGQINTNVDEATNMSNQEILDAVNMKGGKYIMDEEEMSPKQKAYRKFFNGALKKHGASSPSELKGDKKKKFFNYVKANWKG